MNQSWTKLLLSTLCLGLVGAAGLSPVRAQVAPPEVSDLDFEIKNLKSKLDLVTGTLNRTKELYKAGQVPVTAVESAQLNVDNAAADLQRVIREREAAMSRLAFRRPVTIQLDHATVRQFASALSKSTGMSVTVDAGVTNDSATKLTLDAQGVPLANVLEAIANKADLMIAPGNGGVILKRWPHLNNQVIRTATAPWSADWNVPPTVVATAFGGNSGFGPGPGQPRGGFDPFGGNPGQDPARGGGQAQDGAFGGGQPGQNPFFGGGRPQQPGGPNGQPGFQPGQAFPGGQGQFGQPGFPGNPNGMGPMMGMGGPGFSLTNAGDHMIVVGEVGPSDNGEPGIWLTAYSVDNNGFKRLGRTFHPFMNRPRGGAPGGGRPGRGPDPRGGDPGQPGARPGGNGPDQPGAQNPPTGQFAPGAASGSATNSTGR